MRATLFLSLHSRLSPFVFGLDADSLLTLGAFEEVGGGGLAVAFAQLEVGADSGQLPAVLAELGEGVGERLILVRAFYLFRAAGEVAHDGRGRARGGAEAEPLLVITKAADDAVLPAPRLARRLVPRGVGLRGLVSDSGAGREFDGRPGDRPLRPSRRRRRLLLRRLSA